MSMLFEIAKEVEAEIADEVGGIVLFGLFRPFESPDWHVVVSAEWAEPEHMRAIIYVARKLQERLDPKRPVHVSRVVALAPSEEFVQSVLKEVRVDHGGVEFYHRVFNKLLFDEVFIITANPDNKPHAPLPADATTFPRGARVRPPKAGARPGRRSAPRPGKA